MSKPICYVTIRSHGLYGKRTHRIDFYDLQDAINHIHKLGAKLIKNKKNWSYIDNDETKVLVKGKERDTAHVIKLKFL